MAQVGRRPKISPKIREIIITGIKSGMTYKAACDLAGIGQTTFYRWQELGETEQSGVYREFWQELKNAEAEIQQRMLDVVRESAEKGTEEVTKVTRRDANGNIVETVETLKSSPRDWRAAMTFLERRNPEEFARRFVHHGGSVETTPPAAPVVNLIFDDGEGDESRTVKV